MEVTKYYCEVCRSEVGKGQWTKVEIAITSRHMYGKAPDKIYSNKKICDDCLKGLGFPPETVSHEIHELKHELSMTHRFMAVAKKLLDWRND